MWSERQTVTPFNGAVQALLGSATAFPATLFSDEGERYLELIIGTETLSPRFHLTSVAFALHAETADIAKTAVTAEGLTGPNVKTINGLSGEIVFREGANVTITEAGSEITIGAVIANPSDTTGIFTISPGTAIAVDGENGPLTTISVAENGINDFHIADDAVTAGSLAEDAVQSSELADGTAVRSLNGLTEAVTLEGSSSVTITQDGQSLVFEAMGGNGTGSLQAIEAGPGIAVANGSGPTATVGVAPNSLGDDQIADDAITAASLAAEAVGAAELANNAVSEAKIAGDAVTAAKIASGAVGASEIASNAVGSSELQSNIALGPSGSLDIQNGSSQTVTQVGQNGAGGYIEVNQTGGGNFTAAELGVRADGNNGLGGRLLLNGNANWPAIDAFADGGSEGGRLVLREPNPSNPSEGFFAITLRGEESAGQILLLQNNAQFLNIGGPRQEIRSRGRMGLGMNQSEFDMANALGSTLFVRGNIDVTGIVTGPISAASIDHPLDPTNMILSQAGVVSPDMMTMQNGNVTLDGNGEAWVELPAWFESIARDFRYQLTCIGGFANVYIAEKVSNNRFKIAGGSPGLEVSWQISGVRDDPYARTNPITVESEKISSLKGKYLHPEAYGVAENE